MVFKPGDKVVLKDFYKITQSWLKDPDRIFTVVECPTKDSHWGSDNTEFLWLDIGGWMSPAHFELKEAAMSTHGFQVGDIVVRTRDITPPFVVNRRYKIIGVSRDGISLSLDGLITQGWHNTNFTIVEKNGISVEKSAPTLVEDYFSVDLTDTVDNSNPALARLFAEVNIKVEGGNIHEALQKLVKEHLALRSRINLDKSATLKFLVEQIASHHKLMADLDKK